MHSQWARIHYAARCDNNRPCPYSFIGILFSLLFSGPLGPFLPSPRTPVRGVCAGTTYQAQPAEDNSIRPEFLGNVLALYSTRLILDAGLPDRRASVTSFVPVPSVPSRFLRPLSPSLLFFLPLMRPAAPICRENAEERGPAV